MDPNQEMLESFFGPEEQIPSLAEENSAGMSSRELASAESYIRGGMEDVYRRKMEQFFGGKGKKATLKKVLYSLLEGAAGFTGTPGIGARAWAGAQEEYKAKAPLLNRDLITARNAEREREAGKRRLDLKMAELRARAPEIAAKIDGMRLKNKLTEAQTEHELDKALLTQARTENVQAQTEKTGKEIPYIGMTNSMKEAMAAKQGIGNKNPLTMTPEDFKKALVETSIAKSAGSLINAGQGSSSTTNYTKEIPTIDPLTGRTKLLSIDKTSTTSRPGKTGGLEALKSLFGEGEVLDSVKKAKTQGGGSSLTSPPKPNSPPPPMSPGRGPRTIDIGFTSPKEAERIRNLNDIAFNTRMTALTVLDAMDGTLSKGVGPLAGSDWGTRIRSLLNLKDTPEIIAQSAVMRNQLKAILAQSGKAVNEQELLKMNIVEPNKTDTNRELLVKMLATSLYTETLRLRSILPAEEQERMYADMSDRIMTHAQKLVKLIENRQARVDPKTGQKINPRFKDVITPYHLSAASLYPELVQKGLISPKGEIGKVENQSEQENSEFGLKKRTR